MAIKSAGLLLVLGALIAVALLAVHGSRTEASFHLMRIDEVLAGAHGDPDVQFVELKMNSTGQRFVAGRKVEFYDSTGTPTGTFTFPIIVSNGANNSSILVGTSQFAQVSTVAPDFIMASNVMAPSGRVCFETIDCVAYGDFTGDNNGFGQSAEALPVAGLLSLKRVRTASPKNNSTDYSLGSPAPRNNTGASGTIQQGHVIEGTVLLEGRSGHSGATVTFTGHTPLIIDSDGGFMITLPSGTYALRIEKEGFLPAVADEFGVGGDITLNVKLLGGDHNLDGAVTIADLVIPANNLGKTESPLPQPGEGDLVAKGREIYLNVPTNVGPQALWCYQCHTIEGVSNGLIGPDHTHIGTAAATRRPGMSAEQYIRESITDPEAFIPEGVERATAGLMTKAITENLREDQVDALVAFLLTLR